MFLRPLFRRRNGQREAYWALVESYRTERGPRQRTVAYLGRMDEAGRLGVEQAAEPQPPSRQQELFLDAKTEPRFVEIDRTRVRVENCRQFGGPWLALELVKQSDCKQVCIGLVVTRCGLPLGYEVFAGNRRWCPIASTSWADRTPRRTPARTEHARCRLVRHSDSQR